MPKTMKAAFVTESSLRRQDAGREAWRSAPM